MIDAKLLHLHKTEILQKMFIQKKIGKEENATVGNCGKLVLTD